MKTRYLAYYREDIEGELRSFKNGNNTSVIHWLNMIKKIDFSDFGRVDYVVRALGSNETHCSSRTPLDLMGELLAQKLGAKYVRDILTKKRTQQLKFAGGAHNRKAILNKAYDCDLSRLSKNSTFLIIDDVCTTGTTFEEMQRALLKASNGKAKVIAFSLVKTLWNKDYTYSKKQFNDNFYKKLIAS